MNQLLTKPPTLTAGEQMATAITYINSSEPRVVELLQRACEQTKLAMVPWDKTTDGGWPVVDSPSLALGVLRAGERRVPTALAAATRAFPGLPTVLIAGESLTREVVVINRGQVSLIDPSITAERLSAYLKRVLQLGRRNVTTTFASTYTRVFRPIGGWGAAVSVFPSPREINELDITYPWVAATTERPGFTCVLPVWQHATKFTSNVTQQIRAAILSTDATDQLRKVQQQCGEEFLAMTVQNDHMKVRSHATVGCVWLISSRRLPSIYKLPTTANAVSEFSLIPGDVVALHTNPEWAPKNAQKLHGADMLRAIQDEVTTNSQPSATVLYEVW